MSAGNQHILFVFYTLAPGGAEKSVITIANYLADNLDYKITFYVYDNSEGLLPLVSKKITILHGGQSCLFNSKTEEYYRKYFHFGHSLSLAAFSSNYACIISVHEQLPEIAIIQHFFRNFFKRNKTLYISMIHNSPRVYKVYNNSFLSKAVQAFLLIFRRVVYNYIIAVSKQIKTDIKNYPLGKISIMYNALNVNEIQNSSTETLNNVNIHIGNSKYFLNPARITSQKNQLLLIEAFNLIKDKLPHKLLLMGHNGDKKYFNTITERIKLLNLIERVIWIGTDPNPYPYMRCADSVILSSKYESFSLALHEAMVLKTPIITTKFYGYEEFFNESNCIAVEDSAKALAEAMLYVSEERNKNAVMLENAYKHAINFDSQIIAEQFHRYFNEIK